ncbi:MAG: DUF5329 family protein [Pseudomonadota bacterium]
MRYLISLLMILFVSSNAFACGVTEKDKIQGLLDAMKASKITFIRNGEEHDAAYGAKHLQDKLNQAKNVKTAKEFIAKVASKSSHSGKDYVIKLEDGTKIDSAKWFQEKLKDIEAKDEDVKIN